MSAVWAEDSKILSSKLFKDFFSYSTTDSRIYFSISRTTPWANDAVPQQANTSVDGLEDVWREMMGAKLLTGNDISHVVPRHDWRANTVFNAYSNKHTALLDANNAFYIVTSTFNVYKCISNNRGSISVIQPTQTTVSPVEEADGYVWKYMYSISASEQLRFTTPKHMSVKTLSQDNNSLQWNTQEHAIPGGIHAINVLASGNNYSNVANITLTITGDGRLATAVARINVASKMISNVAMTNPGTGYSFATVKVADIGLGTGAVLEAVISPPGGHGSDPISELGGSYLMFNPRIYPSDQFAPEATNEYRQIAIIQDPVEKIGMVPAQNGNYFQYVKLTLNSGTSAFLRDEIVYQGQALDTAKFSGRVAAWDQANNVLKVVNCVGSPSIDVIYGATSITIRYVESITDQQLVPFLGKVWYVNNSMPITRSDDQIDDFKLVLKF
jgi:hypothetical protein